MEILCSLNFFHIARLISERTLPTPVNSKEMEREGWSDPDIAKGYAAEFEVATRVVAEKLSDAVVAGPERKVLDLCTGMVWLR